MEKNVRPVDNEKKLLKSNVKLFSQLYITTQTRDGDMDTFYSHENSDYPQHGGIRSGAKSELQACLKACCQSDMLIPITDTSLSNSDSGKVMEGSVLVNILKPEKCCTFKDYAANIIVPKISKEVHLTSRVDIVFDTYLENSKRCH